MQFPFSVCLFLKRKIRNPSNLSLSNSVWALRMLLSKNVLLSSRDRSVTGRGSGAYKQWNELGVEYGVLWWGYVHMRVLVHMYVCLHTHVCPAALLNSSKPPGCGVKVCLKPKLRRTATSLLWTFPRETWSFIYNKFQLGRLTREASQPRSCGWASQKAAGPTCPQRYFRNVNGMPEWRASEPRAGAEHCSVAICWGPGSLIATASQEWCFLKILIKNN